MNRIYDLSATCVHALVMCLSTLVFIGLPLTGVHAQSDIDVEAPTIEHEVIQTGTAGELQVFEAEVKDNNELESVSFYYRLKGEQVYIVEGMIRLEQDNYVAEIATESDTESVIEYYIEAIDVGGTKVTRGFAFFPLVREIVLPAADPELSTTEDINLESAETVSENSEVEVVEPEKRRTWLYVLGGVLAVGALAGLAAGSDSESGNGSGNGGECGSAGCNITFEVAPP